MRKILTTVCLTALFAAGSVNAADGVTTFDQDVVFTGEVIASPCSISFNNGQIINLGSVTNAPNMKGSVIAQMPVKFSNCSTTHEDGSTLQKLYKLTLKKDLGGGKVETNIPNAYIQFYNDANGTVSFKMENDVQFEENVEKVPAWAQLVTDANNAPVAGLVRTAVTFSVDIK